MINAVAARRIAAQHDDNLFAQVMNDIENEIIIAANRGLYNTHYCFAVDDYTPDLEKRVIKMLVDKGYEVHCYGKALAVLWRK